MTTVSKRNDHRRVQFETLESRVLASVAPAGSPFPITTQAGSWRIAADAQGNTVVAWQASQDGTPHIYARRFDPAGAPQGEAIQVDAAGAYANGSATPDVAVNASGAFVVTWDQTDPGSRGQGSWNIHARRFDAAGAPLSGDFVVTQTATYAQNRPTVAIDDAGDFVVAWMTIKGQSPWLTYAQRYGASGAKVGKAFQVSGSSGGAYPSAAMDRVGNFAIAWEEPDGSGSGIGARRYSANGTALGTSFRVNTTTAGDQTFPELAMDAAGDFVVAWGGAGAYARRYAASGAPLGGELFAGSSAPPGRASVSMDRNGNAVVGWTQPNADHTTSVYARQIDTAGGFVGDSLLVTTGLSMGGCEVAAQPDGGFLVAWSRSVYDPGIFGQEFIQA